MTNAELSKEERNIILHTLGLDRVNTPYRNRFITGPDCDNYKTLEMMVKKELMDKRKFELNEINETYLYWVTEKGMEAIND